MKRHINLFNKRAPARAAIDTDQFQTLATVVGVVLFLIFAAVSYLQYQQRIRYETLLKQKEELLISLTQSKDAIAKLNYFQGKKNLLKEYIRNDSEFLPYYSLLKNILTLTSETPVIESMTIDEKKQTKFVVRFTSPTAALSFLKYIESAQFLKNFKTLTLTNFNLTQASPGTSVQAGYKFFFEGAFQQLDQPNS